MAPVASRFIRRSHMYLALFLTPWMIIYALSGLILNRFDTVRNLWGGKYSDFEKIEERPYTAASSADASPRQIGEQLLADLGLAGSFNVNPASNASRLVLMRSALLTVHRVTYFRAEHRVLIERQRLDAPVALNRAHFRHGYEQPYLAGKIWGAIVDLAVLGMVFWAVSGVLLWWEIKPARAWGALCLLAGGSIFGVLLATI
ncbi:MAG: PepSY domain-containing protein [Verrucomicrobia bacterium]|nr:PepSY domain-containing protein [Verrucomicrobiota bacterium]